MRVEIQRVWDENFGVYVVRKVWRQLNREEIQVARCTVHRLMQERGLQGAVRGRAFKTTQPDEAATRPLDLVDRVLAADHPNQLWVADLTYGRIWEGFVHVAFVIDIFSRFNVGWQVSRAQAHS